MIAAVKSVIGDLDRITKIVKVVGFVASTPDFTAQPTVLNGASEFLEKVFGEAGKHARSAVGVAALPLDARPICGARGATVTPHHQPRPQHSARSQRHLARFVCGAGRFQRDGRAAL